MRVLQITGLALLWVWTGVQGATALSCSDQVSSGDKSVGIWAVDEPSCPSGGGLGCFSSDIPCRFCMAFSTLQSSHLGACTATTGTPSVTPAPTPVPTLANSTPSTTSKDDCPEHLTIA